MGYNHPLPFVGMFVIPVDLMINGFLAWFLFPFELVQQEMVKKQVQVFMIYRGWTFLQVVVKELLSICANSQFQWIVVLLIPFARVSSTWVAEAIVKKCPATNNEDVKFLVKTDFMIFYTADFAARLPSLNQSNVNGLLFLESRDL